MGAFWADVCGIRSGRASVAPADQLPKIVAIESIDFDDLTGMINDPQIIGVQFGGKFYRIQSKQPRRLQSGAVAV